ncbi:FKBP-type peptidyl-prolyl cis-trans isomerase [bacterium]|nr:FKBP-type peptidyl-prolyl cis-trans isomerase [bacterium]
MFGFVLLCVFSIGAAQELKMRDLHVPEECTKVAEEGRGVWINFVGMFDESSETGVKGEIFDSASVEKPFHFIIGRGDVIDGFDQGIPGMCVGGKRQLIIPPHLAYGKEGNLPLIPPNATLNFIIEMKQVMKKYDLDDIFSMIDKDNSRTLSRKEVNDFFDSKGQATPGTLWRVEDKNRDGVISWKEFTGPKGKNKKDKKKEL